MFDDYKMYQKMKDKLREVKINDFDDLLKTIEENNSLKKQLIEKDNEIKTLIVKHDNYVQSLKHSINLEKERIEAEKIKAIDLIQHKLDLKTKEFELERQSKLVEAEREINQKRQEFQEKNFQDLKEGADQGVDRAMKIVGMFLDKVNYKKENLAIESNEKINKVNIRK